MLPWRGGWQRWHYKGWCYFLSSTLRRSPIVGFAPEGGISTRFLNGSALLTKLHVAVLWSVLIAASCSAQRSATRTIDAVA
jgi:hypothetical protein